MKPQRLIFSAISCFIFLMAISPVYAREVACYSNSDCFSGFIEKEYCSNNDVFKNFQNSSCINPGTETSYCDDISMPLLLADCGEDFWNEHGSNYCKENDVYHSRAGIKNRCRLINVEGNISGCYSEFAIDESLVEKCANGCENGECIPGDIPFCDSDSDCGTNGFVENAICQSNDVFQNFITFTCNNPGTSNSYCTNSISLQLKEDCGESYSEDGNKYCKNGSVYVLRTFNNNSCIESACFSNNSSQEILAEECHHGCEDGNCIHPHINCNNDSECYDHDFYTEDICISPGTAESSCQHNQIICFSNDDCGVDELKEKYCDKDSIYQDYNKNICLNSGSSNSSCTINIISELVEECSYKCENAECIDNNDNSDDNNDNSHSGKHNNYEFNDSEEQYYSYEGDIDYSLLSLNESVQKIGNAELKTANASNGIFNNNLFLILIIVIVIILILIIVLSFMK